MLDRDRHPVGRELEQITLIIGEQPTAAGCPRAARPAPDPPRATAPPATTGSPSRARSDSRCPHDRHRRSVIGRRSAAIRPANPLPTGICTPRSTSSSIPFAARARNVTPVSSSNRIAAVSDPQDLRDPLQQLTQQLLLRQIRQRRIRDALQRFEHLPAGLEAEARDALGDAAARPASYVRPRARLIDFRCRGRNGPANPGAAREAHRRARRGAQVRRSGAARPGAPRRRWSTTRCGPRSPRCAGCSRTRWRPGSPPRRWGS